MAEEQTKGQARTYRRVTNDLKEVRYIVALIDEDVKARAKSLAESNTDDLREILNTQASWRQLERDLAGTPSTSTTREPTKPRVTSAPTASKGGDAGPQK